MHVKSIPLYFQTEALNTTCHIHNCIALRLGTSKTNYEIWKRQKPNVKYFHIFGSLCHILGDREVHHKQNSKSYQGIFLGYSTNSQVYRVYNQRTKVVMESINIIIHDHSKKDNDDDNEALPHGTTWTVGTDFTFETEANG